jgi:hypothetical protein
MLLYFADHSGLSLNTLPLTKAHRAAFWRFRNTVLNDKSSIDFMTTVIQYYFSLAIEGENILYIWGEWNKESDYKHRDMKTTNDDRRTNSKSAIYLRKVNFPKQKNQS